MFSLITNYLEPLSYLIYFITVFSLYRAAVKWDKIKVLLLYYAVATGLMSYASTTVYTQQNNLWAYNILFVLASVFIGLYFYLGLTARTKKFAVAVCMLLNTAYFIIEDVVFKKLFELNSFGFGLLSLSVMTFGFMFFHQVINNTDRSEIYHQTDFWFVAGFLLYYLGSFSILVTYNYLTLEISGMYSKKQQELLTLLWGVHNILLFLSAIITLTGIVWVTFRKKLF